MTNLMSSERHFASFRDPSGFLFKRDSILYRQINKSYSEEYDLLLESGLFKALEKNGRIISQQEVDITPSDPENSYKVVKPELIPFISYPFEWSFSQLKEAALVTLTIQERALKVGMSLKDASGYNIQFNQGKAILIDTLSFEFYKDGEPWVAYKQFCQHFLAPLALMAKTDVHLNQLLRNYIDGIPLELASKLLPKNTKVNPGLMMHIHMHANAQVKYANSTEEIALEKKEMSKQSLLGLIDSLKNTIKKLSWSPAGTEWGNYYEITNYSDVGLLHKKQLITEWLSEIKPKKVWDLGANNGFFSRIASDQGIFTVSFDIDPAAVEQNFLQMKEANEKHILPLTLDLTNPSPAIGWHNRERESFTERAPTDMVFALALIHHLTISNNVPFSQLVNFFRSLSNWLIIEFIPKSDSQVQKLLHSRLDIFDEYNREDFESAFETQFSIRKSENIKESERYLYLMEKK